jgi:hypothetical protein
MYSGMPLAKPPVRRSQGGKTMNYSPVISTTGPVPVNDSVNSTEIIVHINEALDSAARNRLQSAVLEDNGVFSAEFCPGRYHLLLVQYNTRKLSSRDVLSVVVAQNLSGQLVGPI